MPRTKPTYLYAIISVALVLFILGFFALTALHGRKLVQLFKEKVDIWLELKNDAGPEDVSRIVSVVREKSFVKPETVTFVTREQAAAAMREDLGDASLLQDLPELMRDVIRFNIRAEYANTDTMLAWREELRADTMIAELYYEAATTGNIGPNLEKLGWITLTLGFLLIFAAVTLIHNTIRLALYSNRFLIKNQELVGASWEFISRPYLRRGIWNGLLSAVIAIAALILGTAVVQRQMPEIRELQDLNSSLAIYVGLLVLGVLISGLSTWFVVNKFLRMRVDELY